MSPHSLPELAPTDAPAIAFVEAVGGPQDDAGRRPRRGIRAQLPCGSELTAHEYTGPALVVRPDHPAPVPMVRVEVVGAEPPRLPTVEESSAALIELGGGYFTMQLLLAPGIPVAVPPGAALSFAKVGNVETRPAPEIIT